MREGRSSDDEGEEEEDGEASSPPLLQLLLAARTPRIVGDFSARGLLLGGMGLARLSSLARGSGWALAVAVTRSRSIVPSGAGRERGSSSVAAIIDGGQGRRRGKKSEEERSNTLSLFFSLFFSSNEFASFLHPRCPPSSSSPRAARRWRPSRSTRR